MAEIITKNDIIEEILNDWKDQLNSDYLAYKNHVYRVFNFSVKGSKNNNKINIEKLAIAISFHDLGIWSDNTFDYLEPSINLANDYLCLCNKMNYQLEISQIIKMHHKITKYKGEYENLVESVRCGDLIDLSLGMIKFNLSSQYINQVKNHFPNNGFHKKLISLSMRNLLKTPLNPLPMLKW